MGGWSNINIRGKTSDFDFILKVPGIMKEYDKNPYEQQHRLAQYFSKFDLTPSPIEIGRFSDAARTPFYLIEYIEGNTYSKVTDVREDELLALKESLRILRSQKPPNLRIFGSANEYLIANHSRVQHHPWLSRARVISQKLLDQYLQLYSKVEEQTTTIDSWSGKLMHGDLWIPNVIFRSGHHAILLDLEACAYGDPLYDLASLLEVHVNTVTEKLPLLIQKEDCMNVNLLRPVVLSYVIDWSLERLLSMESGIVEPNLNTTAIYNMLVAYTREKIDRLTTLIG
jgi:aminoglycoside phosphotransferase (APT) family kinase protein